MRRFLVRNARVPGGQPKDEAHTGGNVFPLTILYPIDHVPIDNLSVYSYDVFELRSLTVVLSITNGIRLG